MTARLGPLSILAVAAAWAWAMAPSPAADPPAPAPAPSAVLNLVGEGHASGDLADSPEPGRIRWRSPRFVEPLDFAIGSVTSAQWPAPAKRPEPAGPCSVELAGGDVVFGDLTALDDRRATIEAPGLGRLVVDRAAVRRIDRWKDGPERIYSGPNGLDGWSTIAPKDAWRDESGQPVSDREGATLRGDLGLPPRAVVEFEVSWKGKPDFALALGVDDAHPAAQAFRFEVWEGRLVALRETEAEADIAPVGDAPAGGGRAHLQVYLDQPAGRMLVTSSAGEPLADLKVGGPGAAPAPGVELSNLKGDVRLERLRIGRWNGDPPRVAKADQARIHLADGTIVYGQIPTYDAEAREFVVRGEDGEARVPADRIASVFLAPAAEAADRAVRATAQDGTRLSGSIAKVEGGALWLDVPGIDGPARLPVDALRSLVVLKRDPAPEPEDGRTGKLELDGLVLRGHLADAFAKDGASPLAWRAEGASSASPIRPDASGRIVYREPAPAPKAPQPQAMRGGRVVRIAPAPPAGLAQGFLRALTDAPHADPAPAPAIGRRAIHLRTGDVIPAEILKIDEAGVWFKTPLVTGDFIPNDRIKAVELAPPGTNNVALTKAKKERLLTLPRMQKESPPTHMIRARNGDYLRGRVVAMDDKALQVEVRLDTRPIPRDRIARIIWLHPDETDPAKAPAAEAKAGARVQALRSDGVRLTFAPESFANGTLAGTSDVLGAIRVPISQVDQILLGSAIESTAAKTAYGPWRLTNAVEPKIASADGFATSTGTESALVGKPAPDFKLDLLDGTPFQLASTKGQVVILDFWATWCGPCLMTMPQVERVADEFKDRGVRLIAVNLEEGPAEIKAMMERQKLRMTVALDRDGVAADRYAAAAIPQTVIIDRNGNVARLFVGGSGRFDETLRKALNEVLDGQPPAPPADGPVKD